MSYPAIDLNGVMSLLPIKEQLSADPEYLDRSDCPYGADIRAALRTLFPIVVDVVGKTTGRKVGKGKSEISEEQANMIETEATTLLQELRDLKPAAGGKAFDHETKISIIKAKTALIEKVVNIQERFFNVRKVSTFMKTVIAMLEKHVDADHRNEFLKELEPYL